MQPYGYSEKPIVIVGPDMFSELVPLLVRGSIEPTAQIQTARIKKASLRGVAVYGGNGPVYGKRDGNLILYMTHPSINLLFDNPKTTVDIFARNEEFVVNPEEAATLEAIANDPSDYRVVSFNLSRLPLEKGTSNHSYVRLDTSTLAQGRKAFVEASRKEYGDELVRLVDRAHGGTIYTENGVHQLLLKEEGSTQIILLNPEHLAKLLKELEKDSMIARASVAHSQEQGFSVDLSYKYLHHVVMHMCGILAEGAEEKLAARKEFSLRATGKTPQKLY